MPELGQQRSGLHLYLRGQRPSSPPSGPILVSAPQQTLAPQDTATDPTGHQTGSVYRKYIGINRNCCRLVYLTLKYNVGVHARVYICVRIIMEIIENLFVVCVMFCYTCLAESFTSNVYMCVLTIRV